MKGIWGWAERTSGVVAIWERPNAPRPPALDERDATYVGLNVEIGPSGSHELPMLRQPSPGEFLQEHRKVFTLSVRVYGPGCMDVSEKIRDSLDLETVRQEFELLGLATEPPDPTQDLSSELESGFEERAGFDVRVHFVSETADPVGTIEHAELTNEDTGDEFTVN